MAFFDYDEAFSRNIGWVTRWEQQLLRHKKIAIAGMGGVGGVHLLTLVRLGIQNFHIADFDRFELANFNRQAGAMTSTLGQEKVQVLLAMARDINPDVHIKIFSQGISQDNVEEFLDGVDLYVDGLDAFVFDPRIAIFDHCHRKGIPGITAGPLGMSTAYVVFMPGEMSFEDYFGLKGRPFEQQAVNFLAGLNPRLTHSSYLMDHSTFDIGAKKGPSLPMACQLAAGVAGTEVLKILLKRGRILAAPWYHAFDPYKNEWALGRLDGGYRNFFQNPRLRIFYKIFGLKKERSVDLFKDSVPESASDIERILDYARWAPSGDNTQLWRFKIKGPELVEVQLSYEKSIYNFGDRPLWQMAGFLIGTLRIAASVFGYDIAWEIAQTEPARLINVRLIKKDVPRDALFGFIKVRSVNRGAYQKRKLLPEQKNALERSLGDDLVVQWLDDPVSHREMTGLSAMATDLRLSIKETLHTHQNIVDYDRKFSPDKIPVAALGLFPLTQKIMRWGLQDWSRMDFFNRFMAGTLLPKIEMDFLPGSNCAGYFLVTYKTPPSVGDLVSVLITSGERMQRFWLELTRQGLCMQPCYAPIAFSWYAKHKIVFTENEKMRQKAQDICQGLERFAPIDNIAFIGRIGFPKDYKVTSRSVRRPLSELMIK